MKGLPTHMPANPENIERLPAAIVDKLRGVVARIRRVFWLRGAWLTVAAALAGVLAVMAVDALLDLESVAVRSVLSLAALTFALAVAWRFWVRPLSRRPSLASVARMVEIHHPEMEERISTAVELLGREHVAGTRGSEELLDAVVKSAVGDAVAVRPEAEFSSAAARWPKRLALAALVVLAGALAVWPFHTGILLLRALVPFADIGNASSFQLRMITRDLTVAEGDPLSLLVAARGRLKSRVDLHQVQSDGQRTIERMAEEVSSQAESGETVHSLHIPAAKTDFRYHVTAGRARTREFGVTVLKRPDVAMLRAAFTFPEYTGLPPRLDENSSGDFIALPGTRIDTTAVLTLPATAATLAYDQTEEAGPPVSIGRDPPEARWSATLTPGMNIRWRLMLKGEQDIDGRSREGLIRAAEDLSPDVVIDSPLDRELSLRPNEILPVVYTAADDFGFSAVDLRVRIDGRAETVLPAALPAKDASIPQTWHGTAALDLSKLPLAGIDTVRLRLRVSDNLPSELNGPQTASSDELVIRLDWGARAFAEQTVAKQDELLRRELEKVRDDLHEERARADEKMHQLRNRDDLKPEHLEQLEQLTAQTAQTAVEMRQLAEKMEHSAFADRAGAIANAAEEMVQPASEALQQIPQSDDQQQRSDAAEQARNQLAEAIKATERALGNLPQDNQQAGQAAQLASLAQRQQQLANAARDAANPEVRRTPANAADPSQQPPGPEEAARAAQESFEQWQEQQQDVALATPTAEQGVALAALESGRWRIESGTFTVHDGPGPSDPLGLLRELRVSDWVTADGELTLTGRKALARWLDRPERRGRMPRRDP